MRNRPQHLSAKQHIGLCIACAGSLVLASAASAQQSPPPVLAMNSAGLDAVLSSSKDQPLRELLHMLAPRLSELPAELNRLGIDAMDEVPDGLFEMLWAVASQPQAFEVSLNLGRLRNQELPVDIRWAVAAKDFQGASNTVGFVRNALRDTPLRLRAGGEAGSFIADTPATPLYFGTRRQDEGALIYLSTQDGALPGFSTTFVDLPHGVEQVFGLRFDLGQLTPVIGIPIGIAPPIVGELLMEAGLVGWNATRFDLSVGLDDSSMHSVARMTGAARAARMFAVDPQRTLTKADFAMVPGDATTASIGLYDASRTWKLVVGVLESLDLWDNIQYELSSNLDIDTATVTRIIGSLGDVWVYYQSDTTGGGDFSSTVMSVSIRDRETLEAAIATAVGKLNAVGRDLGRGYVRVRAWERNGIPMYSINAPGLPVPVEPTFALSGDRLVIAMSAPSLIAAVDQVRSGQRSLADRADLLALVGGNWDGIAGFQYQDTARYAKRGYGMTNHMMAALANAVRSPGSNREPYEVGAIMPSYNEFTQGIVPTVAVTRFVGEDLVITARGDRSMTVHLAASLGKMNLGAFTGQFLPAIMAGGGISGFESAVSSASFAADQARSSAQVRQVVVASFQYSVAHGDTLPAGTDAMLEAGVLLPSQLRSPYGSMMDGRPDIVVRADMAGKALADIRFPNQTVWAIDRSALMITGETAVGFLDGHIEWLDRWALNELMAKPDNAGARRDFGL